MPRLSGTELSDRFGVQGLLFMGVGFGGAGCNQQAFADQGLQGLGIRAKL